VLAAAAQANADVLTEFDRLVDPGHSHREALLKVYKKRIKRIKRIKKKEKDLRVEEKDENSEVDESDDEDMDDKEVRR
jgi:hypothetical protein